MTLQNYQMKVQHEFIAKETLRLQGHVVHFHDCWTHRRIVHEKSGKINNSGMFAFAFHTTCFLIPGYHSDSLKILIWSTSWVTKPKVICHSCCKHIFLSKFPTQTVVPSNWTSSPLQVTWKSPKMEPHTGMTHRKPLTNYLKSCCWRQWFISVASNVKKTSGGSSISKFRSFQFSKPDRRPFWEDLLLMEEILHHMGCIKPCK